MSVLPNQTNINNDTYFFLLVDAKVINTSTINANTGTYDKLFVNTISTGSVVVNSISTLTASISSLNTNSISSGTGFISSFNANTINVSSLIGQTASISSIFVNNISSGSITTGSINGNSNFDASKWYLYPAEGSVTATLGLFGVPQYDISNFRNIYCRELNTTQNVNCGNTVNALVGTIGAINCPDILMSPGDKVARLDVYGTNLLAGNNVLYVEGGTTLTGGGVIHGVTIGALQVGGIDTVRIDVLPAGMDLISATFITINAVGAVNVSAGGALSLAGGSYIEYNSDQHYFINTSAGNDFTDIFVGNIKGAYGGVQPLNINEGRGVAISNVKSLYLQNGESSFIRGSPSTSVAIGGISSISISTNAIVADYIASSKSLVAISTLTKDIQLYSAIPDPWSSVFTYDPTIPGLTDPKAGRVSYLGNTYDCVTTNLNVNPSIPIPNWLATETYYPNNYAFVAGVGTYKCVALDLPNPSPPNTRPVNWVFFNPSNSISIIWLLNNSITESGITGDEYSYIRVGSAYINTLNTSNISINGVSSIAISTNTITANTITANTISNISSFLNDIQLNSSIPNPWNALASYSVGNRAEVGGNYYIAIANNLNLEPTQPIPNWNGALPYYPNNYAFVAGVGSYRCVAFQTPPVAFPPNGNPGAWVAFDPTNSITNVWSLNNTGINSGITGDKFSYIRVGSGYFDNLITSTINVSSITATNISSITAENITTEFLKVSYINNITADGITENITIGSAQQLILTSGIDTNISGTENITLSSSNINLLATDFINAQGSFNFNDNNLSNIGHLSAVSTSIGYISTGTLVADTVYSFSTLTSTLNFYNATGRIIDLKYADEEGVGIALYRNIDGVPVLDALIGTDNIIGFSIVSISTINIQASTDDIIINSGKVMALGATEKVLLIAPEFQVLNNASISSINTNYISSFEIFTNSIFTNNLGNPNPFFTLPISVNNPLDLTGNSISNVARIQTGDLNALNISTNFLSTGSLLVNKYTGNSISTNLISTGSLIVNNYTGNSISTNLISSGSLLVNKYTGNSISTNLISTGSLIVNNYTGNSISTNLISSGSLFSGSLFSGAVSTPQLGVSSIITNTILSRTTGIDRLTGGVANGVFNTYTNNLFPNNASGTIGYGPTTAGGGFYGQGCFISTFTSVIQPGTVTGQLSNVVRINGIASTQNIQVSSINNKLYPYTSTLNIPFSSFSITGNQAGTPILLYSNVDFRTQGFHRISQKSILSKNSGGASADIHGNIFYTVGAFPSTPSITDGYSALPFVNQDNASTFTTLLTEFYVSTPTTRNILYYDARQNNYTARLYMGTLFDTLTPDFGNNPTRIPANIL